MEHVSAQPEEAAQEGGGQLRLPFIDFLRVLEEFDVALDYFWPGNVAPAPEFWRGGTGNARDGGGVSVVLDGDSLPLEFRERLHAGFAFPLPGQQHAAPFCPGLLRALEGCADALGLPGNVGSAERGH